MGTVVEGIGRRYLGTSGHVYKFYYPSTSLVKVGGPSRDRLVGVSQTGRDGEGRR